LKVFGLVSTVLAPVIGLVDNKDLIGHKIDNVLTTLAVAVESNCTLKVNFEIYIADWKATTCI